MTAPSQFRSPAFHVAGQSLGDTSICGENRLCPGLTSADVSQQSGRLMFETTLTFAGGDPQKRSGRFGLPKPSLSRSSKNVTHVPAQSSFVTQLAPLLGRQSPRANCSPGGQLHVPSGKQPLVQPGAQQRPPEQLPEAHCGCPNPQAPPLFTTHCPLPLHD